MTVWQRWTRQPQGVFLRRALFQIHLWSGIALSLYVLVVCLTGSVLVYRNELYRAFSPQPVILTGSGAVLTAEELTRAAHLAYPDDEVTNVRPGETPNHAVEIAFGRGEPPMRRLFHPFTGVDLGDPLPPGYRLTAWLLDLHDNLLFGQTGRRVNGVGAIFVVLLCFTGAVIWWPGITAWRRSLFLDLRANWKRLNWTLHSMLGFWFFGFILLWGITGSYLSFPETFTEVFDYIEPWDADNPGERIGDRIQYWLAYLHFGRLGGRGIPGCGRGLCDSITKAVWAGVALIPPVMVITGLLMWWNRVIRPSMQRSHLAPLRPDERASVQD